MAQAQLLLHGRGCVSGRVGEAKGYQVLLGGRKCMCVWEGMVWVQQYSGKVHEGMQVAGDAWH